MGPNRLYTVPCVSRLSLQKPENRDASSASGNIRKAWKHMAHAQRRKAPVEPMYRNLSRPINGHTLRKLPAKAAISRFIAQCQTYSLYTNFVYIASFFKKYFHRILQKFRRIFYTLCTKTVFILHKPPLLKAKSLLFINNLLKKAQNRGIIPYIIKRKIFDRPSLTKSGLPTYIRRI